MSSRHGHRKSQRMSQQTAKHARSSSSNDDNNKSPPSEDDLDFISVGVAEFLEFDPRPTFVVYEDFDQDLDPVYLNRSIRSQDHLMKTIPFKARPSSPRHQPKVSSLDFIAWIREISQLSGVRATTISYLGLIWTGFIVRKRWIVISGDLPMDMGRVALPVMGESATSALSGQRTEIYRDNQQSKPRRALTSSHFDSTTEQKEPSFITPVRKL